MTPAAVPSSQHPASQRRITPGQSAGGHLAAGLFFVAIALVWSFPLATHLSTHIAGPPGDNFSFLWNDWWMRQFVGQQSASFFITDHLFAPFGINITLDTHTALPSFVAATAFSRLSVVAAHNLVIIGALAANGLAAYALAFNRTHDRMAAVVAGVVFGGSPFISIHLLGHVDLINAWGIPLFLLFFLRAVETGEIGPSVAAGLAAIAVAYTDYYFLVYCAGLAAVILFIDARPLAVRARSLPIGRTMRACLIVLAVLVIGLIVTIIARGGFEVQVSGLTIRARSTTNPLSFLWILVAVGLLAKFRLSVARRPLERDRVQRYVRVALTIGAVAAVGVAPLAIHAWSTFASGAYVSPDPSWRSGPGGVDLATMVLGHPLNHWMWPWTTQAYDYFGINSIESTGWMGIVPLVLAWKVSGRFSSDREVRLWCLAGAVFFVWALGPWLRVAGLNTGLLLPQNFFSYIPILSNARMPGRAMVVVFVCLAMLCALCVSTWRGARRRTMMPIVIALVLGDFCPAPFPLTDVAIPSTYAKLRATEGGGAVCELPVGVRDGLSMIGVFDDRVLLNQTAHERPIVGGFAARVPDTIRDRYSEMPVVRSLFKLSGGQSMDAADSLLTAGEARDALRNAGIRFVVLNRDAAPERLVQYVHARLPLTLTATEGSREFYTISSE